jgi:CSLREA domain-containing protein
MPRVPSLVALLLVAALAGIGPSGAALALPPQPVGPFVVNATGDRGDERPGNGACATGVRIVHDDGGIEPECTLRAAIQEANAFPGADTIRFGIAGTGVQTIRPASPLPTITETVTIDGYTQPGARPNTAVAGTNAVLLVELDGTNAGEETTGLSIAASNSVVRGLVINRFRSVLGGVGHGIAVVGDASTTGVRIAGNFLGTNAAGTEARGNMRGLFIAAQNTIVGSTVPADRNLISGNRTTGILLGSTVAGFADGSRVQGNLIGTDKTGDAAFRTGAPLSNGGVGVIAEANDTLIGGKIAAAANTIAFNGGAGVQVNEGTGNRILRNRIFANGGLGIDLRGGSEDAAGATANDRFLDADDGPNTLQNKPVLRSATTLGATTTIAGRLNSGPNTPYVLRFFANPAGGEEGKTFLGQLSVFTDVGGAVAFRFVQDAKVAVGQTVTATATNGGGNTSEFSAPRTVESGTIGG